MRKLLRKFIVFVAPYIAIFIISFLKLTMRFSIFGDEKVNAVYEKYGNIIMTFWHGRLLMMPVVYKGKGIHVLISMHEDGEIISKAVKFFGIDSVRGSTTRGATKAIRDMVRIMKSGKDIAITPDGPKGPRFAAQNGAVILAKLTGIPICPVSFCASKRIQLSTWDGFNIPMPFSMGVFFWGEPVYVSKKADKQEIEEKRKELESSLRDATNKADAYF